MKHIIHNMWMCLLLDTSLWYVFWLEIWLLTFWGIYKNVIVIMSVGIWWTFYSVMLMLILSIVLTFFWRLILQGDKNIIKFDGDHNSPRPQFYFDSISIFFNNVLQPPADESSSAFFDISHDCIGRVISSLNSSSILDCKRTAFQIKVICPIDSFAFQGAWSKTHELRSSDNLLSAPAGMNLALNLSNIMVHSFVTLFISLLRCIILVSGPAASSTEDAIKQLRTKRPMSRTEVVLNID